VFRLQSRDKPDSVVLGVNDVFGQPLQLGRSCGATYLFSLSAAARKRIPKSYLGA
jgi:hypothetical protein